MDASEYYDFEDRRYVNPTVSRDEQLGFVNQLRDTMGKNTAQINSQTQALGTNVPSSLGGLTGSNSYFTQRYQTTPVQAQTATLKATAQAKALNDLMTNYQNQAANRYQQAYRNAYAKAKTPSGGGGGATGDANQKETETDYAYLNGTVYADPDLWGGRNIRVTMNPDNNYRITRDADTGEILEVLGADNNPINYNTDKYYRIMSDNMLHSTSSKEYQDAVAEYNRNKDLRDAVGALEWIVAAPIKIGEAVGNLITGTRKTTYTGGRN